MKKRVACLFLLFCLLVTQIPRVMTSASASATPAVNDFSYSFDNSYAGFGYPHDYFIPRERYRFLFGNNIMAKTLYEHSWAASSGNWEGNCFGMTVSAILFAANNGISPADFNPEARSIADLSPSDRNSKWDMTLTEFIEALQISQCDAGSPDSVFERAYTQNENRWDTALELVSSFEASKEPAPPVLCLYSENHGQAVIPYHLEVDRASQTRRLYVYDPNFPLESNRFITIDGTSGNPSHWEYQMSPNMVFDHSMSLIPYEDCLALWNEHVSDEFKISPEPSGEISKYSYSFYNSRTAFGYPAGYYIPKERFILMYGNTALAKQKYQEYWVATHGGWGGNCYGMSSTAGIMAVSESEISPSSFRTGATRPGMLDLADANPKWNGLTLLDFIESMQISQYSNMFAITKKRNENRLSALTAAVSVYENGGGGPVLICVYGSDRSGHKSGHALLGYRMDNGRLYVYDCNYPNDGDRYITISGDNWSYPINDSLTWSNIDGDITYIPFETYLSDWTNRGRTPQTSEYVSLTADVADAVIRDSDGKEVAVFENGVMTRGSDTAYPFTPLGITKDGVSTVPAQVSVWLPVNDVYTLTNRDASKPTYEAWLSNVRQGVSVTTNARSVTLSAEDSTNSTLASITELDCDYAITQMGEDEVTFKGRTVTEMVSSSMEGASVRQSGITSSASVTLNGKPVSIEVFLNGRPVNLADLAKTLVETLTPADDVSGAFEDVPEGKYFFSSVMWAVKRGITKGTSKTMFSPQNTCTRNHILTFLWRSQGSPAASVRNPFTDVNPSNDFGKAALWAYEKGLVSGGTFDGGTPCSRAEAVTYLWKLAGRPAAGRSQFSDVPSTAEYAEAVSWAVQRGVTNGTSDTTFSPSATCTRGQIVTFLYRAYA